eukprot:764410-Hanusia_phi.AAC.2
MQPCPLLAVRGWHESNARASLVPVEFGAMGNLLAKKKKNPKISQADMAIVLKHLYDPSFDFLVIAGAQGTERQVVAASEASDDSTDSFSYLSLYC